MKKYVVEITFSGSYQIEVEASDSSEACDKVQNSEEFMNLKWEDAGCREITTAYADEIEGE